MDKREFHDLAFAEQGAEENFGDTIERIYARVVAERDAARAERDALRALVGDLRVEVDTARRFARDARKEHDALREKVLRLRDACESVAQNMEASGELWTPWHTSIAAALLRDALEMTAGQ